MYDFENEDKIPFNRLDGLYMKIVVDAIHNGRCEVLDDHGWNGGSADKCDLFDAICRVKSAPYTLEDALSEVSALSDTANFMLQVARESPDEWGDAIGRHCYIEVKQVSVIIEKLAASLEAKS